MKKDRTAWRANYVKAKAKDYAKKPKGNLKDEIAERIRIAAATKQVAAQREEQRKQRLKLLRAKMTRRTRMREELEKLTFPVHNGATAEPIAEEPMEIKPKRRAFDFDC